MSVCTPVCVFEGHSLVLHHRCQQSPAIRLAGDDGITQLILEESDYVYSRKKQSVKLRRGPILSACPR